MLGSLFVPTLTTRPRRYLGFLGVVGSIDAIGFLLEGLTIIRNR